jgi:membrane protein DedA with SNARE-associated domain
MTGLIATYGPWAVFALMVPESACIPVPSEVTLLFSGFAVHQGWMSLAAAVAAATAGNLAGSLLAYWVGATGVLSRTRVTRAALERSQHVLARHGTRAVFIARLLPLARTFVSLPAGARHVPLGRFVALTVAGCALWAFAFVLAGALLGASWAQASSLLGRVLLLAGLLVLALTLRRRGHARARRRR